ncbi:MAG TPA: nucleosidase [Marmoricola sp.]|jgi:nucleoside phosphorylase|nr:nucleosidase [Marmoricola sp.]
MRTLVVVALAPEARYVPAGVDLALIGLGKTHAATAVTRELARGDVAQVVNLGTAGALRPGLAGTYEPSVVINHDMNAAVIRTLGYDPEERLELETGDGTVLATGDVFVSDPVLRDRLAVQAQLVDMEGYAVTWACRQFGVPVRLVKHVSDTADESALAWEEVVDASARALATRLEQVLDEATPGPVPTQA